ncbi:MAG: hypothetical protein WAK31_23250 [Chthoniobacterales bacterium]
MSWGRFFRWLVVTVVEPVNLYGCTIGDDCFIVPFVEIQRGIIGGKRWGIQSHAFVCELVNIWDDCFISHEAIFINDLFSIGDYNHSKRELTGNHLVGAPRFSPGQQSSPTATKFIENETQFRTRNCEPKTLTI